jgi:HMG box factor
MEGPDPVLVAEIGDIIHEHLMRDASCAVKTWSIPEIERGEGDVDMGGVRSGSGSCSGMEMGMIDPQITESSSSSSSSPSNANTSTTATTTTTTTTTKTSDSFLSYLSTITSWHKLSPEITQYITTPPTLQSLSPSQSPSSQLTPIALLPYGFSLSTSDIHARLIPLTDAYAPVDHWQWMATLWRGIVGPDLTIYVKGVDTEGGGGGVEVRADCKVIVVRVGKGGKEGLVRRLGFEVGEFVRGGMGRG